MGRRLAPSSPSRAVSLTNPAGLARIGVFFAARRPVLTTKAQWWWLYAEGRDRGAVPGRLWFRASSGQPLSAHAPPGCTPAVRPRREVCIAVLVGPGLACVG